MSQFFENDAGELYEVPDAEVESFLNETKAGGVNVKPAKMRQFKNEAGDIYDVPEADVEGFLDEIKAGGLNVTEVTRPVADGPMRYFKNEAGEIYDVPEAEAESFLKDTKAGGVNVIEITREQADYAHKGTLGGAMKAALEAQAQGGAHAVEDDGSILAWLKNAWNAISHSAWGRLVSGDIENKSQKLARGVYQTATENRQLSELIDEDPEKFDEILGNYFRDIAPQQIGMPRVLDEWEKTYGKNYTDGRERRRAKLAYAQSFAEDTLKSILRNKKLAAEELAGREGQWQSKAVGGLLNMIGYMLPMAMPAGIGFAASAATEALDQANKLRQDQVSLDDNGNLVWGKGGDTKLDAAAKGLVQGVKTATIEKFGGKILSKFFKLPKLAVKKITPDKLLSKVELTINKIASSSIGKALGKFYEHISKPVKVLGWHGMPEEMGEEFLDGAVGAALGVDRTEEEKSGTDAFGRAGDFAAKFFTRENLWNLAQSMVLMQAIGGGSAYLAKRHSGKEADAIIRRISQDVDDKKLNKLSADEKWKIIEQHYKGLSKDQMADIISKGAGALDEFLKKQSDPEFQKAEQERRRQITPEMEAQLSEKIAEYSSDENIARMIKDDFAANLEDNSIFADPEAFDEAVAMSARKFEPEALRLKVHDIRGTSMNEGEKITAIEELGVTDWQSAEEMGLAEKDRFGRYTGGAVQALNVIVHGTTKLQEGVKAGTVSGNLAENLLTAATCELGGRSAEERGELIDGILDRANGDEALADAMIRRLEADVDLNATVSEKLDRALTEAKAEAIKERNPSAGSDEVKGALVEPVEMPDGTITTTGEFVHGERGENTERPMPSTPLEGVEQAARLKGAELTFAPEGELKCQSFPEMRVSVSADGVALNNLSGVNIADPARSAEFAAVVAQVVNIAKRNGIRVIVDDVHKPIIQALTSEIQSEGLAKTQAKLDTRSKLFSLLFKTTLGTDVTYDEKSFVEALEKSSNGRSLVNNHGDIYGLVDADGALHFNPAVMNFNTPIHEYGHLALDAVKKINSKLWEQGKKLIRESEYYRSIVEQTNDPENPYSWAKGNDDAICDEALATMIGDRGEKLVLDRGVDSKLKAWLKEVWKAFKGAFGLADLTDEQVEKMTLEEFVDTITAELLSGREFGTKKKLPPTEKSVKRYDETEGSGSNGLYRFRNERGYLFAIPVDMERTQPGGKVVFATDDANITDWIQTVLHGYDLRMSKSGKIYVKGRNGLPDELALIFGRFPTAGQNDGLSGEIANAVGNAELAEASPEELVSALRSDRANYDAWAKAKADGKSLEDARQEQYWADEAAREEAQERERWENSGMGILDYVRSRIEEGVPEFDLDWEIAREIANDWAQVRLSARALIDGRETAVSAGYPLSIRDARDPEKVLPLLSSIVGKSAAQIGEMKLTRIDTASIEHLLDSKVARWDRDGTSRDAKRLWRGRVGGISVIDDIIATSDLGLEEAPAHFNKNWKKGAKFYKADTRFAIEVERGYEIYPCQLIVAELKNGERFVYDLVEIKKPTLSASVGNANLSMTKRSTGTGESVASSGSISQTGGAAQARFSVGGIYTGSAADYANRSRQGGVDDGPSLVKIGSGEGAQVYGWGLYGSTVRGVAEGYASKIAKSERRTVKLNGEEIKENSPEVEGAVHAIKTWGSGNDPLKAAQWLESQASRMRSKIEAGGIKTKLQPIIDRNEAAAKWIRDNADKLEVKDSQEQIYEQTFFTNRAPGDESHLLKWYEPVSDEQLDWIMAQAEKEGLVDKFENNKRWLNFKGSFKQYILDNGSSADAVYEQLSNSGIAHSDNKYRDTSEFLARAGIDGVKYPVDSYGGKTVKDGDKVGWNYVSFRDDNIRVDHKWTDGKIRFSIGGVLKRSGKDGKIVDVDQQRLTAVMRGLETGELKHPRFTQDEFAASKGVRHERLWSYLLSLESPDIHAGGGQGIDGGKGGNDSQGSKGMGLVRRVATRYGSNPEKVIASRHKYFDKGVESKVYVTGGDTVIKVRKLNAYDLDGVKHELAKIVYHNYLFPNDAYTLRDIAVWNKNGYDQFYLIIEQPLVRPKTDANGNIIAPSEEAILKALNSAGRRFSQWDEAWNRRAADVDDDLYSSDDDFSSDDFVASGRKMAYNDEFVVYDFKPGRNTFIDAETGEIRFIDPRVDINDPGAGFSVSKFGKRKIDNRSMSFDGSPSNAGRARFQYVRGVDWSDITMDIFKFVPSGTLTAMGETEQSAAGLAGAIEKRGALRPWTKADSPADRAKPIAFDAADMVMFWRAVSGSLRNPHVQKGERIKGRPDAIGLNIGGDRIEIVSKLFGVIDESDIKKLHEDCRAEGYFRNENTDWCAANDKGAIEDERLRSQAELDRRTRDLYKTRVETGAGGEHYATQVLGHEIGHTLGLLPTGAKLGKAGDAMRTLYEAFESELKRQTSGLELKRGEDNLSNEIGNLIAWWHGTETMPEYYAKPKEKFAELFGIFLTQPESVQSQAPKAYDLCVKLIAGNEKLTKAYQTITALKWDGKSNDAVMAEVRKTWDKEAQDQYRELVKLTKESMSLKRDKFFYSFDDRFGPMFAVAKRSLKKLKQDLKEAVRNRTMSKKEAADIIKAHEDEINALQTSLYNFQRHTGGSTRLMVSMFDDVAAQAEKDGVNWNDVRDYAHYMRVIEVGGRATAHGVDPARASAILDRMREKLGDEKWLKIEKTWKAYRATYEKYVLDDPYVQELFDAETMKMLYNNKHYITMRHRMSLEEAKDWQERIEKSKKGEDNLWDPCIDIQRRLHKGLGGSNGEGGGFVLYHLVGSFEATEDPLAATIRRAIEIKESAARNHLLKQMSDTLRSLGVRGVYDIVAGSKETQVDTSVYGKFYYMDSGVKHELIVPEVIHKSMSRNADDVKWFNKAFRFWKNLVTSWSPRFVSRAYRMDISSMETNIEGMHKAPVDVLSEALCFGYVGVPLYLVNDYVARFTRFSKTPFGKILWNENTANHYAHQAQQIVKIAYEGRYSERLAEARRLRDIGETSRAKEIEENVALAQEMMKLNIFQSNYNFNKQLAGFDGEEIMHQFGYRLNGKNDRKVADTLAKRLWAWSKGQARKGGRWWARLGEEQEAVPKVIAMLYQMKKGITGEEAAATAIEYGGTPNLSRRGAHANLVEALTGAFWNVRKNASLRTAKAIKDHPTEWMVKNFAQTAMPTIVKYLMIGGVVEELIRNLFDDDEEKIKNNTVASMMYGYSRFIRESMKCVPGYMQRNYNVIPWAKFGNEVLSFRLKYSPEEFMIKRTIHGLFQAWGADPTDPSADWSDLTKELMGSVLPDVFGENPLKQMAQIVIGPFTGDNPFDNFRGRYIYDPTLFAARGDNKGAMAVEMLKQLHNTSPLNQLWRFSDGQDRNVDYSDMPKWLDVIVNGPIVSLMPGAYLSITSDDAYIRALADIDDRQKANARIVAGDLLAECIENGRLGGFDEGLKDLPTELKRLAIRHVLNGWRQFHMDPRAKHLRTMRRIKDPNLKRKAREWIREAEMYGD